MSENNLIITAIVAIVAVSGLVIFNSGMGISGMQAGGLDVEDLPKNPLSRGGDPQSNQCDDSDLGKTIDVKGYVVFYDEKKGEVTYNDWCFDENTLKEYYCVQLGSYLRPFSNLVTCDNGCVDGVCV